MNHLALRTCSALLLGFVFASTSAAASERVLCVYDPMGTNGFAYQVADDFRVAAKAKYQIDIRLKGHINENTIVNDLSVKKCDGAVGTGMLAGRFTLPSGTLDAVGALPSYDLLKEAVNYMAQPRLASKMVIGNFEIGGIYPAGFVYFFTSDKTLRTSSDLARSTIAVMEGDMAALEMTRFLGAKIKTADATTMGTMLKSGSVDVCYAPATSYEVLKLDKGITPNGGVIGFPLSQQTFQVVLNTAAWPKGFGQWGRTYAASQFDRGQRVVAMADSALSTRLLSISAVDKSKYEDTFKTIRLKGIQRGVYNRGVLNLLKRIRCYHNRNHVECSTDDE